MTSIQLLHDTLASLLYPFGDKYRQAEAQLNQLETQPEFVCRLLELVVDPSIDIGVRRIGAVYLKNKVTRSWAPRSANVLSDADKHVFKTHLITAIVACHPTLRDFLIISLAKIMEFDYQEGQWPELVPDITKLLQNTDNLVGVAAGMRILRQVCKFYRWNLVKINKQLGPLMAQVYPLILNIAEAAVTALSNSAGGDAADTIALYYDLVYEYLKIYKLSTTRFLPETLREENTAKRTAGLFLHIFILPLPAEVLNIQPASERTSLIPVKCQKWATGNIVRTHNNYLTKSYSQLSENAAEYAPYRQLFLSVFAPEITKLYIQRLQAWSEKQTWFSDNVLFNIVTYIDAMIDFKQIFTATIETQLNGLIGQVLFPLMCPTEDDLDLFEDDPVEFVQRQVDIHEILSPAHVATDFIYHIVRKRKNTLPLVMEYLQNLANGLINQPDAIKERVGLFKLLQALQPIFLAKGSTWRSQLEPILIQFVIPDLSSQHAYLRNEACSIVNKMATLDFQSRDAIQQLFQGILACFFDNMNLPVQVSAAQALQSLSEQDHNQDVRAALRLHITDVIRNLLSITQRIDLESLLVVLDHFVGLFPDQITPFAVELAAQLCQQFMTVASELAEAQRQINENGGGVVAESEALLVTSEKTTAGYGIMNSLANLQNNLEHQRDLTARLDEVIAPVFLAVYQHELVDFYPDCLSLHENTLFTLKVVPTHHWQYFDMLIEILKKSKYDYFEDAMPVLENYILYGSTFLAENQALLAKFVHLLVSFYGPCSDGDYSEASAIFTDARTRAHVMSIATKLLVSNGLFNGPLLPYIPELIEAVIARVSLDNQKASASFPPRYNVATVSVVLGGLYHDPGNTLMVLHNRNAVESFFETWFQTLPELTRVNDLKLCVMGILSLLSYRTNHPEFELGVLPQLVKALMHSLAALPGAASRVAELMKNEDAGLWDDDDFDLDEYEEELDDEYEGGGNDASAEFEDQMPESSLTTSGATGSTGDGNFMYEQPAGSGETAGGSEDPDEAQRAEIRSALVSQMGFIADDFDEDMYSVSPLDNLNPYDALRTVFSGLQTSKPDYYQEMMNTFSEGDKMVLTESLQRQSLPNYSPAGGK